MCYVGLSIMTNLDELENKSIYIIREAYRQFGNIGVLWSMGKDSTTVLWLCRKAFFGQIPFPIIHIDTGFKFKEMYEFRERIRQEWKFTLLIAANTEAIKKGMSPIKGKFKCCTALKTNALKNFVNKNKIDALILAIRRDEHNIRAKERYFSPRDKNFRWDYANQNPELWDTYNLSSPQHHIRVHPLLHWSEMAVWEYIKREKIPVNSLYFARHGVRYRSLGCIPCTKPIKSTANTIDKILLELKKSTFSERSGRAQDKETAFMMQKLRSLGYM